VNLNKNDFKINGNKIDLVNILIIGLKKALSKGMERAFLFNKKFAIILI